MSDEEADEVCCCGMLIVDHHEGSSCTTPKSMLAWRRELEANELFARQRQRYEQKSPDALDHYDRMAAAGPSPEYVDDDGRCSGLVICDSCGEQFYDHPRHPYVECLTITCEGRIVKL